ncbi:MAG: glycosyltransferase [Candidatus Zipacnadales bacterium]
MIQSSSGVKVRNEDLPIQPRVTIFVPARDEEAHIRETLECVVAQDYPHDKIQLLFVDGMSTDRTRKIATQVLETQNGIVWEILDNPQQDLTSAYLVAQQHAQGDVFIYVCAHASIAPNYVSSVVRALREIPCDGVSGPQIMYGRTLVGRAIAIAFTSPFGVGGAKHRYIQGEQPVEMFPPMPAFRTHLMRESGGLSPMTFGYVEDVEYWSRLKAAGARLYVDPRIHFKFYGRQNYGALFRQMLKYGTGRGWASRRYRLLRPDHLLPMTWVASLVGALILAIWKPLWGLGVGLASLAIHEALSFIFAVHTCRRRGESLLLVPLVMLACLIMHLNYGVFFVKGFFFGRDRATEKRARQQLEKFACDN